MVDYQGTQTRKRKLQVKPQLCNRKWTVVQNNPTQRKWKMGSLFTISNTQKVRVKHIKYVSQQSLIYAPGSVHDISNNEKAILFSEYAS